MIRALNLYSGIGGNRILWENVAVTAVENDVNIAECYRSLYTDDTVIVGDAHQYLIENYMNFDFVWSSPPCPSHGQYRYNIGVKAKGYKPLYPDMKLYEEIIFLQHHFSGKWVVENTISYYKPLVQPIRLGRHYLWSNFDIDDRKFETKNIGTRNKLTDYPEYDLRKFTMSNKRQVLRNCVDPDLGLHILNCAMRELP